MGKVPTFSENFPYQDHLSLTNFCPQNSRLIFEMPKENRQIVQLTALRLDHQTAQPQPVDNEQR
jgi:hypothetical protein